MTDWVRTVEERVLARATPSSELGKAPAVEVGKKRLVMQLVQR
jgi:hypothetical protein